MLYLDSSNVKNIRTVAALGGKHSPLVQSQSCCCLQENFTQPFSGQFNIPNIFINDFYYFSVLCIVPLYDSICTCITLSLRECWFRRKYVLVQNWSNGCTTNIFSCRFET